ncbi:integral membrane protein GPR137 [Erpetoichthys calabaricus]|uniref:G protein-coupled receptor 137 n=1 Tax=Erpetoichthys calabaricus TaxID=27687 RepID=A0A8C4SDN3_ERPCA|nr:integral membrane protein GPR137 [Erpetoichthys calabaricus]XP_028665374.1 integral membrane protein GPR137 [Erpetoichthys calabaricus]XP_028665378.1 integral membrane protein GPR137 [Erpetoichthys calabaricus]XP_028665384.1 integral membrane protein GPR137 [Erpetoichthys calabaricus]
MARPVGTLSPLIVENTTFYFSLSATPQPLKPAVPPSVKQGVTAVYATLYGLLFLFVYLQLWLVLLYRHKRLSYQTVFLFLCLLWAGLRTTLFSFYFRNTMTANHLDPFSFWLLYCCPVCLQFFTLNLMNLYFAQVVFKAKTKFNPEISKGFTFTRALLLTASLVFLLVNLTCALLVRMQQRESWTVVLVRVLINDTLFILEAVSLAASLVTLAKLSPSTSIYLQAKGTTVCRTAALGTCVILLFTSRACYNLAALVLSRKKQMDSFDFDWYNISDQADLQMDLGENGYLVFGVILFVWELLPTALLVGFFRVRRPSQDRANTGLINGQSTGPRSYFFDNPHQYEVNFPAPWLSAGQAERSSLTGSLQENSWYGAMTRNGTEAGWFGHNETAPLLFARDTVQTNQHHSLYSTPQN